MGLMLSVLIGCVGVLELLACLRHVANNLIITINQPATPCLSYHEQTNDNLSTHDSICSYSHSADVDLPRSAKHKLENLHEYSLRIRAELRSRDKSFDYSSEYSPRDVLQRREASPDSRLSPDFNYLVEVSESENVDDQEQSKIEETHGREFERETSYEDADKNMRVEGSSRDRPLSLGTPEADKYVRIPTPIPFNEPENYSSSDASSDVGTSFDNDSGNEAPTMKSLDPLPLVKRYKSPSEGGSSRDESDEPGTRRISKRQLRKSHSRSPDVNRESIETPRERSENVQAECSNRSEKLEGGRSSSQKKRTGKSSSTIVRKPTWLKSKTSEVSKSAENLSSRRSKRHRDPERRKSDISVQTGASYRDESTNTSPVNSPALSRSDSRKSVSVQVQTSFEETLADLDADAEQESSPLGLSESRRDLMSRDRFSRRTFKNRRFGLSRDKAGNDDDADEREAAAFSVTNAHASVERPKDTVRLLKISSFEEAEVEDYEKIRGILAGDAEQPRETNGGAWKGPLSSSVDEDTDYWDAEDLIFSGEYTKAMNKDWHSGHFCCWQCDESLTGQRYVLRDEHPYCIKCYESVFANGCEECNKIIGIDSKDLSYKDKHWHEACFLCNRCRVSLVDKQFGSKVDKIYCGNCYDAQFASRCDGCGEIFRAGTKKMEYKTRQWHEKCFCCVVCKNPIGTKSFIPREQEIYCAGCYEDKFATRCVKCNKIITSGGVTYKNEPWHRDCFTCSNCNNSLAGQRFTSRDDKPYCADCFGELFAKRCTACSKPITGIGGTRFISFEDRHWHNDCFICAGCKTSLVGRGFITDNEDIICPECAKMKLM
ncbi:four and a half LIM domains protein limpet isoform X3 [Nomia melanderi]|uniref:four and a half LIM domains protein limpet isoform X3 n=1 Tax=Nomia melanderi TaxID=2448451 RepID=UPI0013041A67|nr:PDZ and LIM domain protein 5 isoform X3 [Nomia melanderi]